MQISGWLKRHGEEHVSHETIYSYIWKNKRQGGLLYKELRHQRPAIVEAKTRLGDWELNTIIGARHKGVIVSMVERTTKLTKLVKVSHKTAEEVGQALIDRLDPIKAFVQTLTADNGKEFAYHQKVGLALEADFYFATPYHSWERGLNEHTNGLVRQYFPKTQSFTDITLQDVARVETLINNRPRAILGYETPREAFGRLSKTKLYLGAH